MKFLVLALCVSVCLAVPASRGRPVVAVPVEVRASAEVRSGPPVIGEAVAAVLRSDADSFPDGSFSNSFETENGIFNQAVGELKTVDKTTFLVTKGEYSYKTPEGQTVLLKWVADENGFHPESDSIPVAPPVPEQIQRALEYIAAHPEKQEEAIKAAKRV